MNSSTVALFSFVPSWQLSWAISGLDWLMSSSINPTWLSKLFVVSHPTVLIGHFVLDCQFLDVISVALLWKWKAAKAAMILINSLKNVGAISWTWKPHAALLFQISVYIFMLLSIYKWFHAAHIFGTISVPTLEFFFLRTFYNSKVPEWCDQHLFWWVQFCCIRDKTITFNIVFIRIMNFTATYLFPCWFTRTAMDYAIM